MSDSTNSYIIQAGQKGADRLKIMARATWPTSERLLQAAGLKEGMRCLDLGCGNGEMTRRIAKWIGPAGHASGWDIDPTSIELAKSQSAEQGLSNVSFEVADASVVPAPPEGTYDLIYARFICSHLKDPKGLVQRFIPSLKKGGVFVVEDVDFAGHFSYPACAAYTRYVELYQAAATKRGADPLIGPKLLPLLADSGLAAVQMRVELPAFNQGEGKRMAWLTLESIQAALVQSGLSKPGEISSLLKELQEFEAQPTTIMSLPRIFQVWGVRTHE